VPAAFGEGRRADDRQGEHREDDQQAAGRPVDWDAEFRDDLRDLGALVARYADR
jgi:hypothetical protein